MLFLSEAQIELTLAISEIKSQINTFETMQSEVPDIVPELLYRMRKPHTIIMANLPNNEDESMAPSLVLNFVDILHKNASAYLLRTRWLPSKNAGSHVKLQNDTLQISEIKNTVISRKEISEIFIKGKVDILLVRNGSGSSCWDNVETANVFSRTFSFAFTEETAGLVPTL